MLLMRLKRVYWALSCNGSGVISRLSIHRHTQFGGSKRVGLKPLAAIAAAAVSPAVSHASAAPLLKR